MLSRAYLRHKANEKAAIVKTVVMMVTHCKIVARIEVDGFYLLWDKAVPFQLLPLHLIRIVRIGHKSKTHSRSINLGNDVAIF